MLKNKTIYLILILLLFGCKKSEKNKIKKGKQENIPGNGPLMSIQPPVKKNTIPIKRIKSFPFRAYDAKVKNLPNTNLAPELVFAGNFTGNGNKELVYAGSKKIEVLTLAGKIISSIKTGSKPQLINIFKPKNKKYDEFFIAYGNIAKKTISLKKYWFEKGKLEEKTIYAPKTSRAAVADLFIEKTGVIWFAHFSEKYIVQIVKISADYKTVKKEKSFNMISQISKINYKNENNLLVGRVYGDIPGSNGEIFILNAKGEKIILPSIRGMRAMKVANLDNIPGDEIYIGDGWHKNYGKLAQPFLSKIILNGEKPQRIKIDLLKNNFTIVKIDTGDFDGDKKMDLIVKGNNTMFVYLPSKKWKKYKLLNMGRLNDFFITDLNNDGISEILISKPTPKLVTLDIEKLSKK
jgi:hypothetical protein